MNRITVYERERGSSIYVEWHDDLGRHRKSLGALLGHPITDRKLAIQAAHRMADAQERKRNQQASDALGITRTKRTLADLFERRHRDLGPRWSDKYAKSRELRRAFWLTKLGDIRLERVNAATVERIALDAQGTKSDRWRQDVLRYLVDSFNYAQRKLKWISEAENLSAVDLPSAKGKSRPYTLDEARRLIPALEQVHPVAGWIGTVAFQTGRRLSAIRKLRRRDVVTDGETTIIRFPGETDKARNTGEAVVIGLRARTDWAVPSQEVCNAWLHEAEDIAGIEHQQGRAWHGLKRLFATLTSGMVGADKQSGTRRETLEGHYRQDVIDPKVDVATRLRQTLDTPNGLG